MSEKTRFISHEEAVKAHYFSRSYPTSANMVKARDHYAHQDKRRISAKLQKEERDRRLPEEQIEALDRRLGKNVGAKKERKRLRAMMRDAAPPVTMIKKA